jgi:DNA-binding NtrC family response regulator
VRLAARGVSRAWGPSASAQEGERVLTKNPIMQGVLDVAKKFSKSSIPVLLQGETGTGKEVLSRLIHENGPRSQKPMICLNCGSIPPQLVESTLFGHVKGAFTDAVSDHEGVFEAAAGGTVLLDEIGELPPPVQTALLRVLESKRISRVGSPKKEIDVDVRIIAATHRDLEAMTEAGTFRQDLFFRLNAVTLRIPPLRERREDIESLVARFLEQANGANARRVRSVAPDAAALLHGYSWPGNIRELRNVVERAVVIADGDVITAADLPESVRRRASPGFEPEDRPTDVGTPGVEGSGFRDSAVPSSGPPKNRLHVAERDAILAALNRGRDQAEAATLLGIPLRTLQHKIKEHGIKKFFRAGD